MGQKISLLSAGLFTTVLLSNAAYAVPMMSDGDISGAKAAREAAREAASQRSVGNWYLDFSGGSTSPHSSIVTGSSTTTHFDYNKGYNISLALGYRPKTKHGFLSYTRGEVAIGYFRANLNNDGVSPSSDTVGTLSGYTAMLNGYYDFKNATAFVPYIGAGLGAARISLKDATRVNIVDESDILPAYQFMTGFSIEPKSMPQASLHLGYRYFDTFSKPKFTDSTGEKVGIEQANHSFEGGVRWNF